MVVEVEIDVVVVEIVVVAVVSVVVVVAVVVVVDGSGLGGGVCATAAVARIIDIISTAKIVAVFIKHPCLRLLIKLISQVLKHLVRLES